MSKQIYTISYNKYIIPFTKSLIQWPLALVLLIGAYDLKQKLVFNTGDIT